MGQIDRHRTRQDGTKQNEDMGFVYVAVVAFVVVVVPSPVKTRRDN
jgi:hypothetical protein